MHGRCLKRPTAIAIVVAWVVAAGAAHAQSDISFGARGEDVRVLGRDSRDELGTSVAVGDVSADTIGDVVVGVPPASGPTNNRPGAGEVLVFHGSPDMASSLPARLADTTIYGPQESANLGDSVAVGDLNGDGVGDVIMGSTKADTPEIGGAGTVFVVYGGAELDDSIDLADTRADVRLYGRQPGGTFGRSLAIGDFNADGVDDIAMSAPREGREFGRLRAGSVYIFFGQRGLERGLELYPGVVGGFGEAVIVRGPVADSLLGRGLGAGDVTGDGIDDLLIGGSIPAPFGRIDSGDVYVVFGGQDLVGGMLIDLAEPLQVDLRIQGPLAGDHFGLSVGVGDINGDGTGDILAGAPGSPFVPGTLTGRSYAIFGRPFQPRTVLDLAVDGGDVVIAGPHDGAELGATVVGADLNADGFDEWIVGAPAADLLGQAYRLLGRAIWSELGAMGAITQGVRPGDRAGSALAVGDTSADGIVDLVVAAPGFDGLDDENRDAGAVYVVRGRAEAITPLPNCSDGDGDGFRVQGRTCGPIDCDDARAVVFPTAEELCTDGIDNNCDTLVDQDGIDVDEDGWPGGLEARCSVLDCNDHNVSVNPGASEQCDDGVDNDCNGLTDANDAVCALAAESCSNCVDDDGDGLGDIFEEACQAQPLEFRGVKARRAKTNQTMASQVGLTARLYDARFLNDPNLLTNGLILGMAFSPDKQLCFSVARGRRKKGVIILRGVGNQRARVRLKPRKDGSTGFEFELKGSLALPASAPMTLSVGVFAGDAQYRGSAILRNKGSRVLIQ